MLDFEKKINLRKENKKLSFEIKLKEKSDNIVKLQYNFLSTEPSLDIILNFGDYYITPAYNFQHPNTNKVKITIELLED